MDKRVWWAMGIIVLIVVFVMNIFSADEKKAETIKKVAEPVEIKIPAEPKEVDIIDGKKDHHETVSVPVVKKKREVKARVPLDENRELSKEALLERADKRRESLARERGPEALERYQEQKKRREERVANRKARKEAVKAYHEKKKTWRAELKAAEENGDESLIETLKSSRPKHHLHNEKPVDPEMED